MVEQVKKVPQIKRGEIISAKFLNKIGIGVNTLDRAISTPKQKNQPPAPKTQNDAAEDTTAQEVLPPSTYVETGRETSLVQVFDDEGTNYAEVERIDLITFVNGNGETLSLQFNNTG